MHSVPYNRLGDITDSRLIRDRPQPKLRIISVHCHKVTERPKTPDFRRRINAILL
jgi:hypothetical protein